MKLIVHLNPHIMVPFWQPIVGMAFLLLLQVSMPPLEVVVVLVSDALPSSL
jgi:hypothetical protein